jgi:hypothetical protein
MASGSAWNILLRRPGGEFPGPFPAGCLQNTKLLKRGHAIDPEHDLSGKPHL